LSNVEELLERLGHVVHRVGYNVTHAQLPAKRRESIYVSPQEQDKVGTGWAREMANAMKRGPTAVLEVRLAEAAARKRRKAIERIESHTESGQKVVVFTGRREDCDKLAETVREKFGNAALVLSGHGGTPAGDRDDMQQQYMASPGPTILVGTGDAWGEGVNLQDSDLLLIAMLPYTPGQIIQWEGRVARHGQKRPVMIQYLVAEGSVDEHVAEILLTKLPAVERVAQDDSVQGLADQLRGSDQEEEILDSILAKLGGE